MRKKLAIWLAGLAMVALPASAMALTAVSDSDLAGVTGQAGVSMSIDVTAEVAINTLAWGDADGWAAPGTLVGGVNVGQIAGPNAGGFIGISGLNATFHMSPVHLWTAGMGVAAANTAGATNAHVGGEVALSNKRPLTIDVAGNYAWSALPGQQIVGMGITAYGAAYTAPALRIGLPSSHFTISALDMKVFLSGIASGAPDAATKRVLGNMYIDGFAMELGIFDATTGKLEAGEILIGPTANAGVDNTLGQSRGVRIIVAPKIASISMNAISWGNDGLYGIPYGLQATGSTTMPYIVPANATNSPAVFSAAGYVGLRDMKIAGVEVFGDITISVGTAKFDSVLHKGGDVLDTTMVQISIADGSYFRMASFSADVAVSSAKNLATVAGQQASVLGTFYMDGVSVTMRRSPHMNIDGAQGSTTLGGGIDSYFRIYAH